MAVLSHSELASAATSCDITVLRTAINETDSSEHTEDIYKTLNTELDSVRHWIRGFCLSPSLHWLYSPRRTLVSFSINFQASPSAVFVPPLIPVFQIIFNIIWSSLSWLFDRPFSFQSVLKHLQFVLLAFFPYVLPIVIFLFWLPRSYLALETCLKQCTATRTTSSYTVLKPQHHQNIVNMRDLRLSQRCWCRARCSGVTPYVWGVWSSHV